jgi:phosphate acetyltransferase
MRITTGVDILKIERLFPGSSPVNWDDSFIKKAFTEREQTQGKEREDDKARKAYLAVRFTGKEAVFKAISGCGCGFAPQDIEVIDGIHGRPEAAIVGQTKKALDKFLAEGDELLLACDVSLSFEDKYAVATAIALFEKGVEGRFTMNVMENIYEKAKANPQRVAFPEATEEKILLAAKECADKGFCKPCLVGDAMEIRNATAKFGVALDGLTLADTTDESWIDKLIEKYVERKPINSVKSMKRKSKDPLYAALMMEEIGDVDCTFAGVSHTTGDVILAGQFVVGLADDIDVISSFGIFDILGFNGTEGSLLAFADSAVCTDPTAEELASIAITTCCSVNRLLGWEPRCALLSFSTDGSGDHPLVDKVREAVRIANIKRPDLAIDGEFQLDAAVSSAVAAKKVKRESKVAGKANIIVWPNLDVGNVGVKLVQQFAHADAYGPILQGFAKIISDCSRGAPVSELIGNIAISVVRAQAR